MATCQGDGMCLRQEHDEDGQEHFVCPLQPQHCFPLPCPNCLKPCPQVLLDAHAGHCMLCGMLRFFVQKGDSHNERSSSKFNLAIRAARAGNFDAIPRDLYLRRKRYYRRIWHTSMDKKIGAMIGGVGDNTWIVTEDPIGELKKQKAFFPSAFMKSTSQKWTHYNYEETVIIFDVSTTMRRMVKSERELWRLGDMVNHGNRQIFDGGTYLIKPKRSIVICKWSPSELYPLSNVEKMSHRFKIRVHPTEDPVTFVEETPVVPAIIHQKESEIDNSTPATTIPWRFYVRLD